ncbi:MAG: hypothetical protein IPI91_00640 [Flavobacteriales bacterium]|nr:hypothetical protein [Flavobacteriales bacterium]
MTTTILGVRSTVWMTLFAIVMFAFVSYRAWNTSFTHDECYSFMYYPRDSVIDILLYKEPFTNNHILNSLGMKWSEEVFGNSEFSLRIPNLLALLLFFIYCILLFRRLPILIAIPGFLLMNSNSFLMEMFSIARGYGLSFGFLMMGIYHLSKAGSKSLSIHIILFHFAGLLASLSNFVLLGTYVSMILTHMIFLGRAKVIDPAISLRNSFILSLLLGCISASVMYTPIIRMLEFNDLDFGGRTNFFDSTMWTWIFSWFHPIVISARVTLLIQIAITMIILASVVLTIRKLSIAIIPALRMASISKQPRGTRIDMARH